MAATLDLTTPTQVRDYKEWTSDGVPDSWLNTAIDALSQSVEEALGRYLKQAAYVEKLDVEGVFEKIFYLKGYPVLDTPAPVFRHDTFRVFGTGTEIDSTYYYLDESQGILYVDEVDLASGNAVLEATYTGGMATDTADLLAQFPDLVEAANIQIAFLWESRTRLGQRSVSGPDGSITLESPMVWIEPLATAVARYRRHWIL